MLSQKKVERKQDRKVELDRRRAYALKKYALIDNYNIYLLLKKLSRGCLIINTSFHTNSKIFPNVSVTVV